MGGLARRESGAPLGLVPFLVPGWPSHAAFARTVAALGRIGCAGWELALPAGGWNATTSAPIVAALAGTVVGFDEAADVLATLRPNTAVVYPPSLAAWGREGVLDRLAGRCDQVMLDTPAADPEGWVAACAPRGIGWVEVIDAGAGAGVGERAAALPAGGAIYLAAARETGGPPLPLSALAEAVAAVRRRRADLVVVTGYGISSPEQVARLAAIDGLDAVAIGTALLGRLEQGVDAAAAYFASLAANARGAAHAGS